MGKSTITMQVKDCQKLLDQIGGIQKRGETAMRRTVSDMKSRLPGPIATTVRKYYSIDAAEINPSSTKAVKGKEAANIHVEGKTVASLALVYEGRVLTPQGHGFGLKESVKKNGQRKIQTKIKKKQTTMTGQYGTVFMARASETSDVRIPFQRIPSTGAIEVIRTVAVPEMIDNEEVNAAIYERISEIVQTRVQKNFKSIVK